MKIRIGTRGSKLALTQTGLVADVLRRAGSSIEIIEIKTVGDRKQGTPSAQFGDKKDWIYELEIALLNNEIDLAIHSGKDVPGNTEPGTVLLPALKRASPFDVFVGKKLDKGARLSFSNLPKEAVIGTTSLRRKAQLLKFRPDLNVADHRGNVPTRIEKLDANPELAGIILAEAGLERLGLHGLGWERLPAELMLPAMNQGTLMVQFRENEPALVEQLRQLDDTDTRHSWEAERACVSLLNADCNSAVSVYAEKQGGELLVRGRVLLPSGRDLIEAAATGLPANARELGLKLGRELLDKGAERLIAASKAEKGI